MTSLFEVLESLFCQRQQWLLLLSLSLVTGYFKSLLFTCWYDCHFLFTWFLFKSLGFQINSLVITTMSRFIEDCTRWWVRPPCLTPRINYFNFNFMSCWEFCGGFCESKVFRNRVNCVMILGFSEESLWGNVVNYSGCILCLWQGINLLGPYGLLDILYRF